MQSAPAPIVAFITAERFPRISCPSTPARTAALNECGNELLCPHACTDFTASASHNELTSIGGKVAAVGRCWMR